MPRYHNINGVKVQFPSHDRRKRVFLFALRSAKALAGASLTHVDRDWETLSELEKGNTISTDMKTYRQALRDLPAGKDTVEKCENATWPTKP